MSTNVCTCVSFVFVGYDLVVSKMVPCHSLTPATWPYKESFGAISLIVCQRLRGPLSTLYHTTLTQPLTSGLLVCHLLLAVVTI